MKFTRKQDAHGNRGFSLHLMTVVDWPTGLNDAMSDASSNAGERYCIQTFRATGDMDLSMQAHQQGYPILERPAEPSQAQPGYVPGMPVATGTPVPQAPPPGPKSKARPANVPMPTPAAPAAPAGPVPCAAWDSYVQQQMQNLQQQMPQPPQHGWSQQQWPQMPIEEDPWQQRSQQDSQQWQGRSGQRGYHSGRNQWQG